MCDFDPVEGRVIECKTRSFARGYILGRQENAKPLLEWEIEFLKTGILPKLLPSVDKPVDKES